MKSYRDMITHTILNYEYNYKMRTVMFPVVITKLARPIFYITHIPARLLHIHLTGILATRDTCI